MTIFSAKSADVIMKVVVIMVEMIGTMTISLPISLKMLPTCSQEQSLWQRRVDGNLRKRIWSKSDFDQPTFRTRWVGW